ncbi:MAG: hypothetical protein ABL958_01350 [Bdellovibrionia bacterium]
MKTFFVILLAIFAFESTSIAGESPFPFMEAKFLRRFEKLTEDWKDHKDRTQVTNEIRNAEQLRAVMPNGLRVRAFDEPGYNYKDKSGYVDITTSSPIPHTYRYLMNQGRVESISVVRLVNGKEETSELWKTEFDNQSPLVDQRTLNQLRTEFVEFCRMAKKGGQLPNEVPKLLTDNGTSIEKIVREAVKDQGGEMRASSTNLVAFKKTLVERLKKAGLDMTGITEDNIAEPITHKDTHIEGAWNLHEAIHEETYLKINIPKMTHTYVFGHDQLGIMTSVRKAGDPKEKGTAASNIDDGSQKEIVFQDTLGGACNKDDLKKTYAALKDGGGCAWCTHAPAPGSN